MAKQDIIVVGASAGGVDALRVLVAGLPPDLEAAVFVVLHVGTGINGKSLLPQILTGAGPLHAEHPTDGEQIRHGRIYVAKPDYHMVLSEGNVHLVHGPKENRTRPAINPLFRSAAAAFGPRVAGIILTGMQDDGVAGLAEIKRRGGVVLVQDPATAVYPSMPQNVVEHVETDYILPLEQIAGIATWLTVTDRSAVEAQEPVQRMLLEIKCPDCHGPIWEERQGKIVEYRCRVGHAYSPLAMKQEHEETVERSLWNTVIVLDQAAEICERLTGELGPDAIEGARRKRAHADAIKEMLLSVEAGDK